MLTLFVLFTHIPFVYLEKAEEDKEKKKTHNQLTKVTTLLHLFS